MISNTFKTISADKPWSAVKAAFTEAGLRVDDNSTPESPYAIIRYIKGRTDTTSPLTAASRSVVWDTLANRPVSVTPRKSVAGEALPETETTDGFRIEAFVDGVMIGMFWDKYSNSWRLHTRSVIGAQTRFFSQTKTFATMFAEATKDLDYAALDKSCSYTWILQHPENRIVVPVDRPRAFIVGVSRIAEDGVVECVACDQPAYAVAEIKGLRTWDNVRTRLAEWNATYRHGAQGFVIHDLNTGDRWKVRTAEYNRVRGLRGNSARRDYLWLDLWHVNSLNDYLALYPEERVSANATIERWKRATNDVFHIYNDVFKARSLPKSAIPPKYRPLVFGLHTKYMEELKPAGRTVDWRTALEYMNSRDTAQKIFVLNWDVRQAAAQLGLSSIPVEPATVVGTVVKTDTE
jgi:glycosyltransferase involved in cell wall biosynthesis